MLFNKNGLGGDELRDVLGFVAATNSFERWRTWINLSVSKITALTGKALYTLADTHYNSANYQAIPAEDPAEDAPDYAMLDELVARFQLANALFAYVKLLPSLDAGHSASGRLKTVGANEKSLTAVEAYKDESNILNLAYEALESLVQYAEEKQITEWKASEQYKAAQKALIPTAELFNEYFTLNSTRMFYTLVPMMREVQRIHIVPCVGEALITEIKTAQAATTPTERQKLLLALLTDFIRPVLALGAVSMGLERLPVELFPEGILQTDIIGTVKEKRIATEEARTNMMAKLDKRVVQYLNMLQNAVDKLSDAPLAEVYVSKPKEAGKGFRF